MNKVLVIHNKYKNKGGEDIAVADEVKVLKNYYDVKLLYFENSLSNKLSTFIGLLLNYNFKSINQVKREIQNFCPDIIYFHNTWFKLSPRLINSIAKKNKKIIIKIHNYRIYCSDTYLIKNHLSRDQNNFCPACFKSKKNGFNFFNKVFEDSYLKSFFVIMHSKVMKKVLDRNNIKILVLNEFQKNKFNKILVNSEIQILQNVKNISSINFNESSEKKYIVYAGRISKEKGVENLILSFLDANLSQVKLKIIGDGPQLKYLKNTYRNNNIDFIGELDNLNTLFYIYNSLAVVTATKMFEGQPTLLSEASLMGVLSVFPDFGGMPEYFPKNYQFKFEQYNYKDLTKKLILLEDQQFRNDTAENVKEYYINKYSEDRYYETVKSIFKI